MRGPDRIDIIPFHIYEILIDLMLTYGSSLSIGEFVTVHSPENYASAVNEHFTALYLEASEAHLLMYYLQKSVLLIIDPQDQIIKTGLFCRPFAGILYLMLYYRILSGIFLRFDQIAAPGGI